MRKYPRIPQAFVLLLPQHPLTQLPSGCELRFGIRLFGPAVATNAYVVMALREMLDRGLGKDRTTYELQVIRDMDGKPVFELGDRALGPVTVSELDFADMQQEGVSGLSVRFITPLRLKTNGHVSRQPSLRMLLSGAYRRVKLMAAFYGDGMAPGTPGGILDAAEQCDVLQADLRHCDVSRFSSRQGRYMTFEGVQGEMRYSWPSRASSPRWLLESARLLHLGKSTSFGFGQIDYRMET